MKFKQASLAQDALEVKRAHGKGFLRQAAEILRSKRQNPTLGATDYFTFRLYDADLLGTSGPENFLGWRSQSDLSYALNLQTVAMPGWDKFTFALAARAFGLPVPRLIAVYMPGPAAPSGVADVALNGPDALRQWLRTQSNWPVFGKPSYCQQGYGCHHFTGYDAGDDSLLKPAGDRIPVDRFLSEVVNQSNNHFYLREMGYLFQEVLRPHPQVVELLGNHAISSVRIIVVQDEAGPEIIAGVWRIATGKNDADNFRSGSVGNLVAELDWETGRILRVVDSFGARARVVPRCLETGRSFEDFTVPDWSQLMSLCLRSARAFPLMRIQHWDIAVSDRGPMLLELNDMGAIVPLQLSGRGLLTDRVRDLLREYATSPTFAWLQQRDRR